jgi:hypothetical protein
MILRFQTFRFDNGSSVDSWGYSLILMINYGVGHRSNLAEYKTSLPNGLRVISRVNCISHLINGELV